MFETESVNLPADVRAGVDRLRRAAADELHAVIFFGSRLLQTSPDEHSAADLFVLVGDPHRLYEGLREQGLIGRHPRLLSLLNRVLPPNVISIRDEAVEGAGCKCFVVQVDDFERSMSRWARDHFCKGRLSQHVEVIFAKDEASRARVTGSIEAARRDSLQWVPKYLPRSFTVSDYCLRMLEVSFAGEIRPETTDRVREVFESQREHLLPVYRELLERDGPDAGIAVHEDGFAKATAVGGSSRRFYFGVSRLRATLRWSKYMLTYENWLDYIVRKIHRRTGLELTISPAERRYPLLLLWPKFFRVLRVLRSAKRVEREARRRS